MQPGAARSGIAGLHGGRVKLRLAAPPVDGKANAALIEFLAERLVVARRDVRIAAGESARTKRVAVRGLARPPAAFVDEVEARG